MSKKYEISENLLVVILNYLATKPMQEVEAIVYNIRKEIKDSETEKENIKKK